MDTVFVRNAARSVEAVWGRLFVAAKEGTALRAEACAVEGAWCAERRGKDCIMAKGILLDRRRFYCVCELQRNFRLR